MDWFHIGTVKSGSEQRLPVQIHLLREIVITTTLQPAFYYHDYYYYYYYLEELVGLSVRRFWSVLAS